MRPLTAIRRCGTDGLSYNREGRGNTEIMPSGATQRRVNGRRDGSAKVVLAHTVETTAAGDSASATAPTAMESIGWRKLAARSRTGTTFQSIKSRSFPIEAPDMTTVTPAGSGSVCGARRAALRLRMKIRRGPG